MEFEFKAAMDGITTFVREHRAWAAPIVFLLAFGESIAFVSLVLPFWGMLVGLGALIGSGWTPEFWTVLTAAAVGAALGDWVSYWLGYHYHEQIARMWPLNKYPDMLPKGQKFFERWGRMGDRLRALLRTLARRRADRRWCRAHAELPVSSCQLAVGVPVGRRATRFRRQHGTSVRLDRPQVRVAVDSYRTAGKDGRAGEDAMLEMCARPILQLR